MRIIPNEVSDSGIVALLLGFFGVTAAFLLLPKTIKFFLRRFVFGIVSEVVAVMVTALLSEKLVNMISQDRDAESTVESTGRP